MPSTQNNEKLTGVVLSKAINICLNTNIQRKSPQNREGWQLLVLYVEKITLFFNLCLNQLTLPVWAFISEISINEVSTKWLKQSSEATGAPSSPMPSEDLSLNFWSPWSRCQIHTVSCPSFSVISSPRIKVGEIAARLLLSCRTTAAAR